MMQLGKLMNMTVWKRLKKYIERGADIINLSDKEKEITYED
jgi:hypothetical protein